MDGTEPLSDQFPVINGIAMGIKQEGEMEMDIEVTCHNCNKDYPIEVSVEGYEKWEEGELIQNALPELSSGERELLISATCDECWDEMFPPEGD